MLDKKKTIKSNVADINTAGVDSVVLVSPSEGPDLVTPPVDPAVASSPGTANPRPDTLQAVPDTLGPLSARAVQGKFELQEEIGRGAWSIVYKAYYNKLGKTVAVKYLHAHLMDQSSKLLRFQTEAEIASKLRHQNIVKIFDFGFCADEARPYLISELVQGASLDRVIATGSLSVERTATMGEQMAVALAYAHSCGVIHRDIKPSNIVVNDGNDEAKLVDFGIVKAVAAENRPELTQTGDIVGTPQYMSPEQCYGMALDGRSDVYSLAVVLWECLTGRRLFEGKSTFDCMRKHLKEQPASPAAPNAGVAERLLSDIVMVCLQKQAEARPTAPQLQDMLQLFNACDYEGCRKLLEAQAREQPGSIMGEPGDGSENSSEEPRSRTSFAKRKQTTGIFASLRFVFIGCFLSCVAFFAGLSSNPGGILHSVSPAAKEPARKELVSTNSEQARSTPALSLPDKALDGTYKSADDLLVAELADAPKRAGDYRTHLLNVFRAIRRGISEYRLQGNSAEAGKLEMELAVFENLYLKRQVNKIGDVRPPVFAVRKPYEPNRAAVFTPVHVTYSNGPCELFLVSSPEQNANWNVSVAPNVSLRKVIVQCSRSRKPSVQGVPPGVSLGVYDLPEYIPTSQHSGVLDTTTKLPRVVPLTTEDWRDSSITIVVGPEDPEFRAQFLLKSLSSLNERATAPIRSKALAWLEHAKPAISVSSNGFLEFGTLAAPKGSLSYVQGVYNANWKTAPEDACRFVETHKWKMAWSAAPEVVRLGKDRFFGICREGVLELFQNDTALVPPYKSSSFEVYSFSLLGTLNKRLLVQSRDKVFALDPDTKNWCGIGVMCKQPDVTDSSPFAAAETERPVSDGRLIYTIGNDTLIKRTLAGKWVGRTPLSAPIPTSTFERQGQLFYCAPYLLLVTRAPLESGVSIGCYRLIDAPSSESNSAPLDARPYLHVIEPETGNILLTAPIDNAGSFEKE